MRRAGILRSWEALLLLLVVAAYAAGALLTPYFMSAGNQADALANEMERAMIVVTMTLIIVAGEIDLSVASIAGLASAVLASLMLAGMPFPVAMLGALAAGLAAGLFNGLLIAYVGLPSMIVTIGTLALFRGLSLIMLGGEAVTGFPDWFTTLGFARLGSLPLPMTVLVFLPIAAAFGFLLHATFLGRQIFALGLQPEVARFSGVPVRRIKLLLYLSSGAVSAIAGLMLTARISSARADNATGWELPIVAAVLLGGVNIYGGKGTVLGPILAVLIFAILGNVLGLLNISTQHLEIATGCVLVASVLVTNLLGRSGMRSG